MKTKKSAPTSAPRGNFFMSVTGQIFTAPEIRSSGKRWYVEYKLNDVRKRDYGQVNRIKDHDMRMMAIEKLKNNIMQKLVERTNSTPVLKAMKIRQAMGEVLTLKKLYTKRNTWRSTQTTINMFSKFMSKSHPDINVTEITREHIKDFLNDCLKRKNAPRTRNNYLDALQNIFNVMNDNGLISSNPCAKIPLIPSRSETHVAFTEAQVKKIRKWLALHEPYTLFFAQFITYTFLRPIEIRQLKVSDIDCDNGKLTLSAADSKTKRMVKNIPKSFLRIIRARKIHKSPAHFYIFSLGDAPGVKPVNSHYFEKRFRRCKKRFGLSRLHTMYGLRHTYVSQMIRNGAKWHEVMKQTGHTTLAAFQKYIRSLGAEDPKDLSEFISVKF